MDGLKKEKGKPRSKKPDKKWYEVKREYTDSGSEDEETRNESKKMERKAMEGIRFREDEYSEEGD